MGLLLYVQAKKARHYGGAVRHGANVQNLIFVGLRLPGFLYLPLGITRIALRYLAVRLPHVPVSMTGRTCHPLPSNQ